MAKKPKGGKVAPSTEIGAIAMDVDVSEFASPEVEAKHQNLLRWLEKELLQLQQSQTNAQKQILYFSEEIEAVAADYAVIGGEFEDLKNKTSAEIIALEAEASKQKEEADSLQKTRSEFEKEFREKVIEVSKTFGETTVDSQGDKHQELDLILGKVGESVLTQFSACIEELRMETEKMHLLIVEAGELMIENDELIRRFIYTDSILLILGRDRKATRQVCSAIQDHHEGF